MVGTLQTTRMSNWTLNCQWQWPMCVGRCSKLTAWSMMADDGPVPMDLESVGTHDARATQRDQDASNDMSYDDLCAIAWKGYKAGKGAGKNGTEQERGIEENVPMNGREASDRGRPCVCA